MFYLLTKVSGEIELEICGSQDQCLRPLRYDGLQPKLSRKKL